jgi:hypothetical protein
MSVIRTNIAPPSLNELRLLLPEKGEVVAISGSDGRTFFTIGVPAEAVARQKPARPTDALSIYDRLRDAGRTADLQLLARMQLRTDNARKFDRATIPEVDISAELAALDAAGADGDELAKELAGRLRRLDEAANRLAHDRKQLSKSPLNVTAYRPPAPEPAAARRVVEAEPLPTVPEAPAPKKPGGRPKLIKETVE